MAECEYYSSDDERRILSATLAVCTDTTKNKEVAPAMATEQSESEAESSGGEEVAAAIHSQTRTASCDGQVSVPATPKKKKEPAS
jgi:hypothetical protein